MAENSNPPPPDPQATAQTNQDPPTTAPDPNANPWIDAVQPASEADPEVMDLQQRLDATEAELKKLSDEAAKPKPPDANVADDPLANDPVVQETRKATGKVEGLEAKIEKLTNEVTNLNGRINRAQAISNRNQLKKDALTMVATVAAKDPILASNPEAVKLMLREVGAVIDRDYRPDVAHDLQIQAVMQVAKQWRDQWAPAIDKRQKTDPAKPPPADDKRKTAEQLNAQELASTTVSGSPPPTVTTRPGRVSKAGDIYKALMDKHAALVGSGT